VSKHSCRRGYGAVPCIRLLLFAHPSQFRAIVENSLSISGIPVHAMRVSMYSHCTVHLWAFGIGYCVCPLCGTAFLCEVSVVSLHPFVDSPTALATRNTHGRWCVVLRIRSTKAEVKRNRLEFSNCIKSELNLTEFYLPPSMPGNLYR
jgi:hypothetical protein